MIAQIHMYRTAPFHSSSYYHPSELTHDPQNGIGYTYVKEPRVISGGGGGGTPPTSNNEDELSTVGSILGASVCFLLFCLIIFSIAYPLENVF